jgi:putative ABC transport system permease protein
MPLLEWQTERARDFVWALAGAVALLLALAVASSATLLVGRAESRAQELRVRRALGAGGRRLTAHLLADPVLLCTLAAAAALPGAWTATEALREASALELPRIEGVPLPVIATATIIGLALLLVPAFGLIGVGQARASRAAPASARIAAWAGLRRALLGTQVAVAVILLTAMLALGSSVRALAEAPLGFRPDGVLTFYLSLPDRDYPQVEAARALHRAVLADIRALPGVVAAGFGGGLPVPAAPWSGAAAEIEGHEPTGGVDPTVRWVEVSEGFVEVLGVSVVSGRALTERDMTDGAQVLAVNEAFADAYLGGAGAAVGRRVRRSGTIDWYEVAGVVDNTADRGPGTEAEPLVLAPEHDTPPWNVRWRVYVVRTSTPPVELVSSVRAIVRSLDPALPVFDVMTMRDRVRATTARERLALQGVLLAGLASIVVVAASLGGLILLSLLRRRREIGVRKAVGATNHRLRWLLVRGAVLPATLGLGLGGAAVAAGVRAPARLLHNGASPSSALAGAAGLIAVLVAVTGVVASLRVAGVEPSEALREE